jgi:prepilin-type N-terminal cleavage/methylation domain-containing protein
MERSRSLSAAPARTAGFTLIELLVVIAIVALLISILLPALASARKEAQAIVAAASARSVAQGVSVYTTDSKENYPIAYAYASSPTGWNWRVQDQLMSNPVPANGHVHWSYFLFSAPGGNGSVPADAFQSPVMWNRGAPRTNPGPDPRNWEDGQINDLGQGVGAATPEDRQVPRVAFAPNAAIIGRNKFSSGTIRRNRFVKVAEVQNTGNTILITEFLDSPNHQALMQGLENVSKSHRPITPFVGGSAGYDVFNEPDAGSVPRFFYPPTSAILRNSQLGSGMISDGNSALNAVGRSHPPANGPYGGTANFIMVDGSARRMNVIDTIIQRLWGDRFYAITGNNRVAPNAMP